ncbi:Fur family transcriptional regulator [Neptunitalea lumnitzerae]|uniref:Transcriptional regulator n=1 Tax=Neptunitalea lumnitzerae TaxID=2965509 RepID=A0ABQ5MFJ1_9FLAO|nr:transcriptional repressor [Neptunitalea sp. Y10]GLB48181.1 transcriptional regulator [Neptunitalea sp. Y10]
MALQKEELFLKNKNIKPTAMRLLVLQYLFSCEEAVSLNQVEEALPNADKSTIFRSLKTFEEFGVVHSIREATLTKYALCKTCTAEVHTDKHPHFHCNKCDSTICLSHILLPQIQLPEHFKLQEQEYLIHGICDKCNAIA